jgi:hypothetical protein
MATTRRHQGSLLRKIVNTLRNGQGNGEPSVPRIDAPGAFADLPKLGNDMGDAVADVPIIPDHDIPRKKTRQSPRATRKSPMGIDAFRV